MDRQHRWLVGVLAGVAFGGGVSALGAGVALAALLVAVAMLARRHA